jgi:hypothetical protein
MPFLQQWLTNNGLHEQADAGAVKLGNQLHHSMGSLVLSCILFFVTTKGKEMIVTADKEQPQSSKHKTSPLPSVSTTWLHMITFQPLLTKTNCTWIAGHRNSSIPQ